jgi:hypothetical protein
MLKISSITFKPMEVDSFAKLMMNKLSNKTFNQSFSFKVENEKFNEALKVEK